MFRCLLLTLAFAAGPANAHEDRILTVQPDGAIPEIPAIFGPVVLEISNLGTSSPDVQLSVGPKVTKLPSCVTRLIHTESKDQILVTGSWYGDESVLPYYISAKFFEPGYSATRNFNSNISILFNLRTGHVIEIRRFLADQSDTGGSYAPVTIPEDCQLASSAA